MSNSERILNNNNKIDINNQKIIEAVSKIKKIPAPLDTSDATAIDKDILQDKTAYINGQKINGTMTNNGTINSTISAKTEIFTIPKGYHDGNGKVEISSIEQEKIIPENIKSGVKILNIEGTYTGENINQDEALEKIIKNNEDILINNDELRKILIEILKMGNQEEEEEPSNLWVDPSVQAGYFSSAATTVTHSSNSTARYAYISCKPNTTYKITRTLDGYRFMVGTCATEPITGTVSFTKYQVANTLKEVTITSGEEDTYLAIYYKGTSETIDETSLLNDIVVEKVL